MAVLQGLERLSIGSQQPQTPALQHPRAPVAVTRELQALAPSLRGAAEGLGPGGAAGQGSSLRVLEVTLRRLLLPGAAAADQLMHAFQLDGSDTLQPLQRQQQAPAADAQQQLQQQVGSLQPLLKRLAQELAVLVLQVRCAAGRACSVHHHQADRALLCLLCIPDTKQVLPTRQHAVPWPTMPAAGQRGGAAAAAAAGGRAECGGAALDADGGSG